MWRDRHLCPPKPALNWMILSRPAIKFVAAVATLISRTNTFTHVDLLAHQQSLKIFNRTIMRNIATNPRATRSRVRTALIPRLFKLPRAQVQYCYENLTHSFLAFDRVTLIAQHACNEVVDDLARLLGSVVFCVVNHLPERCHGDLNQGVLVEG